MTMKLSKTFLTGILALTLVFGITLAGCENGTGGGDDGGGGGGDSLLGSWVDNRVNPDKVFIFTDVADTAIAGAKVAYYSTDLNPEGTDATGTDITISGTGYTYTLSNNTLTLEGYKPVAGGPAIDVVFDRAKGTSGSTMHGIWVSKLASTDTRYTLLIIRSGSAKTYTAVGSAKWGESPYTLSRDANATYIKWGNGSPVSYTKTANPDTLDITTLPGGGNVNGLMTLGGNW
jgi:hypothetical protein